MAVTTHLLAQAPGPIPWYLAAGVREVPSAHGILTWREAASGNPQSGGKTALVTPNGETLLVLDHYCAVTKLGPSALLVWFRKSSGTAYDATSTSVHFCSIDTDRLRPIADVSAACAAIERDLRVANPRESVEEFTVRADLPEGPNRFASPEWMHPLEELLLLVYRAETCLWIVRPREGRIEVCPQDWFNHGDFDFGYQWPTRVIRDPETGRIVGDGIRIDPFVLDSTNRNVEAWLREAGPMEKA